MDNCIPPKTTFFTIGNTSFCNPCRLAEQRINLIKSRHPEVTSTEWTLRRDGQVVVDGEINNEATEWVKNEEKRSGYHYIPRIWYNGCFLGGNSELTKEFPEY